MMEEALYPDSRVTKFSRYSHQEICKALDQWHETEAHFTLVIAKLPDDSPWWSQINDLERVTWSDGGHHSGGSSEYYPVKKWQKLINQHERLACRIEAAQEALERLRASGIINEQYQWTPLGYDLCKRYADGCLEPRTPLDWAIAMAENRERHCIVCGRDQKGKQPWEIYKPYGGNAPSAQRVTIHTAWIKTAMPWRRLREAEANEAFIGRGVGKVLSHRGDR